MQELTLFEVDEVSGGSFFGVIGYGVGWHMGVVANSVNMVYANGGQMAG